VSTTASQISRLQLVAIPSTDQDRSIAFYEALGFKKRSDFPWGDGYRWVELYPPSGEAGIALVPPGPGDPTAVQTGIILNTDDIDETHAQLRSNGVDVDPEVAREGAPAEIRIGAVEMAGPVPPMFYFRDPDGNSLLIVEPPSES
jgi:catechol 2,3-dioxygenase-like lactoylglutathione lyase family enzyme